MQALKNYAQKNAPIAANYAQKSATCKESFRVRYPR